MRFNSMVIFLFTIVLLISASHVHCEPIELRLSVTGVDLEPFIEGTLIHELIRVSPGDHTHVDVTVMKDARIILDIYELYEQEIDIEIIRPDGTLELPKTRVSEYRYEFTATMSGTYRIRLDNSFDRLFTKYVQIAVATDNPPHTITTTTVSTYTLVQTYSYTTTITHTQIAREYVPTVIYNTITSLYTITETETTEQTVAKIDWIATSIVSIITLIIGLSIGYLLLKAGKK